MTGPPRPTIRRQLRAAAVLLLIVCGVLGSAWGAYRMTVGRPNLDGERSHTFGVRVLVDGQAAFSHTFVLTNTGSNTIELSNIRTTCGCTVAEPSTRTVASGETLEIAATLTLKKEGRKTSRIFLEYGGSDVDVLNMEAWARRATMLTLAAGPSRLVSGEVLSRLLVFRDYETNDEPPAPSLVTPPGVEAAFDGWSQALRLRRRAGMPAQWRGFVRVRHDQGVLEADSAVEISVGPDESVRLPLTLPAARSKPAPAPSP